MLPPQVYDIRLWILLIMFSAWIRRARRALMAKAVVPSLIPSSSSMTAVAGKVSIIIPARNEEKNIQGCLESLLAQDYPDFEIIVANDNSTDGTETILKSFGGRIQYFNVPPTESGWTGKNFALHQAVQKARGDWFLFTDADTRHETGSLSTALQHAFSRDLELLTLIPRCLAHGFIEELLQPTAKSFMGLCFPLEKVNRPFSKTIFGNGQYLLIRRGFYQKAGGHSKVRGEYLEDFGLVREAKKMKARVECALGMELYGTRMYDSFPRIWRGWRRIFLHAFQSNGWLLLQKFLSVLIFSVIPFAGFVPVTASLVFHPETGGFVWGFHAALLVLIWCVMWQTHRFLKSRPVYSLLHPVSALFLAMILLDSAWMAFAKEETKWR